MLFQDQKATVRTDSGETDTISIGKGVQQGCILSPLLFNIYAGKIMRDALELWEGSNLRYADNTTLLVNNEEEIKAILTRVKSASEAAGLFLNISKTKILMTGMVGKIEVNGVELEVVDQYQFLGVLITSDGSCERDIRRRIALGRVATSSMSKIWRDCGIITKVKLIKVLIFPIALYSLEIWVLQKSNRKRIDSFEICCWWRLLCIPWAAHKSNVLKIIKTNGTLEVQVVKVQ